MASIKPAKQYQIQKATTIAKPVSAENKITSTTQSYVSIRPSSQFGQQKQNNFNSKFMILTFNKLNDDTIS